MIKLRIRPGRELAWKRRPGRADKSKTHALDAMAARAEEEGPDYRFQARKLLENFERLTQDRSAFPDKKYIKFVLFPEESAIEEPLKEYFSERFGLDFISIESFGLHSLALFEPGNWTDFFGAIKRDLQEFDKFANGRITEAQFENRRITLIREFGLLTPSQIDFVIRPTRSVKRFSIAISQVKPNAVPDSFILACAEAAGIKISINEHGIIKETDLLQEHNGNPVTPQTLALFIKQLDQSPEIKAIYLDKMAVVDHVEYDQQIRTNLPQIEDPSTTSPVICVIYSGVENNHYTEKTFLEDQDGAGLSMDANNNNPQQDPTGHGTAVACRILFGSTLETNILPNRRNLLPVAKLFPVKLEPDDRGDDNFRLPIEELFKEDGDLAIAIKRFGIKIINLSVNLTHSSELHFPDKAMSREAARIDSFSKKLGVIVVISTGNIKHEELLELIKDHGKEALEEIRENSDSIGKYLRILPPADFLSGISAGSCWPVEGKNIRPSWFTRGLPSIKGRSPIKPDCLAPGGDYVLKLNETTPTAENNHAKSILTTRSTGGHTNSDDYLFFMNGTSFSAPQIVRTLAIAQASYPDASIESIKGLFLHRAYAAGQAKTRKLTDDTPAVPIDLMEALAGASMLAEKDEIKFLTGRSDDKKGDNRTYAVEAEIGHEKMLSFDLPLKEVKEMMTGLEDHKIGIRISVSYFPTLPSDYKFDQPVPYKEANQVHIAACLHSPSIAPIKTDGNQPVTMESEDWINHGLVNWTMDYYGTIQTPFASRDKKLSWRKFIEKLGGQESVQLSVRCFNNDSTQQSNLQRFSAIVTFEDLGAFVETKARGNIQVKV